LELFEDRAAGGMYAAAEGDVNMVLRLKDDHDGAEPSSNSVAALNLLRLAAMTEREAFRTAAEKTLGAFSPQLHNAPSSMPMMLAALGFYLATPKQIVLVGERDSPELADMLRTVRTRFVPNKVVMLWAPPRWPRLGGATAYVCENFVCQQPVATVAELAELLK
jgi:hypothetical protein